MYRFFAVLWEDRRIQRFFPPIASKDQNTILLERCRKHVSSMAPFLVNCELIGGQYMTHVCLAPIPGPSADVAHGAFPSSLTWPWGLAAMPQGVPES